MQEALLRFSQRRVTFVGLIKRSPDNWKRTALQHDNKQRQGSDFHVLNGT